MKTTILFPLGALVLLLSFSSCEVQRRGCTDHTANNYDPAADINDGSCQYGKDPDGVLCNEDLVGNLVITNKTGSKLYLYKNLEYQTCIPVDAEGYFVHLPNQDLSIYTLQIWKSSDVEELENPPLNRIYRQWNVALSNTTQESEQANWLITNDNDYAGSGTLELSYPNIDQFQQAVIYQVDVFLNSKTGAKLASIRPGIQNKKVSIDYGVHYLYFRYWYSNPNSSTGTVEVIGWLEQKDIVINANHELATISIPVMQSNIGKHAEIRIANRSENAISIFANDVLIEDIAKVDGSTQSLSTIPPNDSTLFIIPLDTYTITTKNLQGNILETYQGISLLETELTVLTAGSPQASMNITNNSSEDLQVFDENKQYIGYLIEASKTNGNLKIPATLDSLILINSQKTKSIKIGVQESVIIDVLYNHKENRITMTKEWNELSPGHYESPDISHSESTNMLASVKNDDPVIFSFDYLVSSEINYDVLIVKIDDQEQIISNNSGSENHWGTFTKSLSPGSHVIEWRYVKDDSRDGGNDKVEIKGINIQKE